MISASLPTGDPVSAPPRKKVVGLIRVSTAGQAGDDRGGIPRQREVIRRTIDANNLDCLCIYELEVSGTQVREHPDIVEILRLVSSGVVSGLVLADLDRLFRPDQPTDYAILQTFKDSGAVIFSGDTTYDLGSKDGLLFSGIRATIAGYELALIKERMMGAKEAKRKQGKCPTNRYTLPLGVSYDRPNEKFFYDEKIGIVQELFRLVDEDGLRSYTEMEKRTGVRSVTIPHLLRNRLFIGERVITQKRGPKRVSRTGKVYRAKVKRSEEEIIRVKVLDEPAIDPARFERVQAFIDQTRYNHHEARERDKACNLATGVARCAYCGSRIYCSSKKSGSKKVPGYYYCRSNYYAFKQGDGCQQPNVRQPKIDALLEAFLVRTLTRPKTLISVINASIARTEEVIKPFPAQKPQLQALDQRERRLLDALEEGAITVTEFRERRAKLHTQRTALQTVETPNNAPRRMEIERFVTSVIRGAFALKRLTDPFEKKTIVLNTFAEVFFKGEEIVAFKFKCPLITDSIKGNPVIHLEKPFRVTPVETSVPEGMRKCSACKEVLPVENFYKEVKRCRPCVSAKCREAYQRRKAQAASRTASSDGTDD